MRSCEPTYDLAPQMNSKFKVTKSDYAPTPLAIYILMKMRLTFGLLALDSTPLMIQMVGFLLMNTSQE